jgi:hypothetical protein
LNVCGGVPKEIGPKYSESWKLVTGTLVRPLFRLLTCVVKQISTKFENKTKQNETKQSETK